MAERSVERVLIVEDNPSFRASVQAALSPRFDDIRTCQSVAEVEATLAEWQPELVILDFRLPDGNAFGVLERVGALQPAPAVIAVSGEASADASFELAKLGVRAYLPKPLELSQLESTVDRVLNTSPDLVPHFKAAVGHRPIRDVEQEVRSTMVNEALARTSGSRRAAAKLLAISRQLLQHILRRQHD